MDSFMGRLGRKMRTLVNGRWQNAATLSFSVYHTQFSASGLNGTALYPAFCANPMKALPKGIAEGEIASM